MNVRYRKIQYAAFHWYNRITGVKHSILALGTLIQYNGDKNNVHPCAQQLNNIM